MTAIETPEGLTHLVRQFMAICRKAAHDPESAAGTDPIDRILAAATVGIAAVLLAWPQGRKAPKLIAVAIDLLHHVWKRRSWWLSDNGMRAP